MAWWTITHLITNIIYFNKMPQFNKIDIENFKHAF